MNSAVTTYEQILDTAILLTSEIESYRKMQSDDGTFNGWKEQEKHMLRFRDK